MKVTKISDVKAEDKSADTIFTGGTVKIQFLTGTGIPDEAKVPEPLSGLMVNFSRGARTVFHVHDHPQIIYVTKGKGIVATEKEEIVVEPGTLVLFPAGENHWHGATKDSEFSHLSITPPGKTTWKGKK